jgi:hypothetical protein
MNLKYSVVIIRLITPRIFSSKMLHFGWFTIVVYTCKISRVKADFQPKYNSLELKIRGVIITRECS